MYVPEGAPSWGQGVYQWHVAQYGHPSIFGYKDLVPLWNVTAWDPSALVEFFRSVGAKYVVPMAVHHDNFDNFDSTFQEWNSVKLGPRRDIIGEWRTAILSQGLRFGVSSHNAQTWSWFEVAQGSDPSGPMQGVQYDGRTTSAEGAGKWWDGLDPQDLYAQTHVPGQPPDAAYIARWQRRNQELLDKYEPDYLYFDGDLPFGQSGLELAARFYNTNYARHGGRNEAVMTIKDMPEPTAAVLDLEAGSSDHLRALPWQKDTTLNHCWFYCGPYIRLRAGYVIDHLADTVSKNGNYLLNVGLRADGRLPDEQRVELVEIGRWLALNGESIYATRPWEVYGEGPTVIRNGVNTESEDQYLTARDIRFTRFNDILYAFVLDWPTNGSVEIASLATGPAKMRRQIEHIKLLGSTNSISWEWNITGLKLYFPEQRPCDHAFVFKITPSPDLIAPGPVATDLRIATSSNKLVISWTANVEGFRLQRTRDLGVPAVWEGLPEIVEREDGRYVTRTDQPAESTFYRLVK